MFFIYLYVYKTKNIKRDTWVKPLGQKLLCDNLICETVAKELN